MFLIDTGLMFNGCKVCLVHQLQPPPASLGGLFANYFKKAVERSRIPNYAELMGFSFGIRAKLVKGEKVLNMPKEN